MFLLPQRLSSNLDLQRLHRWSNDRLCLVYLRGSIVQCQELLASTPGCLRSKIGRRLCKLSDHGFLCAFLFRQNEVSLSCCLLTCSLWSKGFLDVDKLRRFKHWAWHAKADIFLWNEWTSTYNLENSWQSINSTLWWYRTKSLYQHQSLMGLCMVADDRPLE